LVPGLLNPRLRGTTFHNHLHHFFKAGSTNDVALELGRRGAPAGTVVIAEEQTEGRGRLGREWHSEKARGIYASILLRPAIAPSSAAMLTIVAGLAAREAVYRQTGLEPDIRWPNDLLLGGRKFAGILTEMQAQPDRVEFVVVGMGINVNHEKFPEAIETIATSLRIESAREQSRLALLAGLLHELERHYNRWMTDGAGPIVEQFSQVSSFARGKRVRVESAAESFTGTTDGIEPGGWLRVRRDDGRVEPVVSGDVREVS
jgi:BirA family biotin operon repressor/biotin-[acetyl-CoA-carboxylase] ligase